jgi:hypothetical protein
MLLSAAPPRRRDAVGNCASGGINCRPVGVPRPVKRAALSSPRPRREPDGKTDRRRQPVSLPS